MIPLCRRDVDEDYARTTNEVVVPLLYGTVLVEPRNSTSRVAGHPADRKCIDRAAKDDRQGSYPLGDSIRDACDTLGGPPIGGGVVRAPSTWD